MAERRRRAGLYPAAYLIYACAALVVGAAIPIGGAQEAQDRPTLVAATPAPSSPALLSDAQMERFLQKAKVVKTRSASKGVTNSTQATLFDGELTHDAHIQIIDEHKREFRSTMGVELDFRDHWAFNIAAYKLDRLIGLNMVPVSVQGHFRSNRAAITWWVDDVIMDEGGRMKRKMEPPADKRRFWHEQVYMLRLFDQLIYNTDRNLGNTLISKDWRMWAIDHTRAFRKHTTLKSPAYVSRCDRVVFDRLKSLDLAVLKRELGPFLDEGQIKAILSRRDVIIAKLEGLGPAVLFDRSTVQ